MSLIFESIILAINNSENPDPTCAIIFAQQYPDIIKYVIKHHPEYFVDTAILHICAEKLDIKELTDKNEVLNSLNALIKKLEDEKLELSSTVKLNNDELQRLKDLIVGYEAKDKEQQELDRQTHKNNV